MGRSILFLIKIVLLSLLCSFSLADCPYTLYPSSTHIGHIQAYIGRDPELHDTGLTYKYQFPQAIEIGYNQQVAPQKNCLISINGFETLRTEQYQTMNFNIQPQTPFSSNEGNQKLVTGVSFKIKLYSTVKQSRCNWNSLKFSFLYSHHPQIFLGSVQTPNIVPSTTPFTHIIENQFPKRGAQLSFNVKRITSKVFLTGFQVEQLSYQQNKYAFDIQETLNKLEELRKYAWNNQLINRFKKELLDNTVPSLRIKNVEVFQETRGSSNNFKLRFHLGYTSTIRILYFSYSYLLFLQKKDEWESIFRVSEGKFTGINNQIYKYQGIQNNGMLLVGFNGYLAHYSKSNLRNTEEFQLEISYGSYPSGQLQQLFLHVQIQSQQSEFYIEYFGIEKKPQKVCSDCLGSPYNYQHDFCVAVCPDSYLPRTNSQGIAQCLYCDPLKYLIINYETKQCQCAQKFYFSSKTNQCQECPSDCLTCYENTCLSCPQHTTLNRYTSRCQCKQIGYFSLNNQICQKCHPQCLTCFGGQHNQCLSCEIGRNLTQERICTCIGNFRLGRNGHCECQAPFKLIGNRCQINNYQCGQFQMLRQSINNISCECKSGFFRHKLTNRCIQSCKEGQIFIYETDKCQCKPNHGYNEVTKTCINCYNYPGQKYNPTTNQCECYDSSSYINPQTNQCMHCPPKSYLNFQTGQCDCIFNYFKVNGQCYRCQSQTQGKYCQISQFEDQNIKNKTYFNSRKLDIPYHSRHNQISTIHY